jgi:hypothetical protein
MVEHHECLREVDLLIAKWGTLVANQKARIAELQRGGLNAAGSIVLLRELETAFRSLKDERRTIARRVERHGRSSAQVF